MMMVLWSSSWLLLVSLCQAITSVSGSSIPDCPQDEGWTCQWLSDHWKATSNTDEFANVMVTYEERPMRQVSIICGEQPPGKGPPNFPRGFLRNFTLGSTTYFRFYKCQQPKVITLGEILESQTVEKLRFTADTPLGNALKGDIFQGLPNLTYLNLMDNGLTSLPENLFQNKPHLESINLRDNALTELNGGTFAAIPQIINLELGNNNLKELSASMDGLQNLQILNVYQNNIRQLSRAFFASMPSLRSIDLQGNLLETLPKNTFTDLKKLNTLKLFTNRLTNISSGLLSPLEQLEEFDISDNPKLHTLPSDLLRNLTTVSLAVVNLRRCGLQSLPQGFLSSCVSLRTLYLDWNNLTALQPEMFHGLFNLEMLDLSRNQLTAIDGEVFRDLSRLKELRLERNRIKLIAQSAFYGMGNLHTLDLSHNRIDDLPEDVFKLTTFLERVDLSHNYIQNVDRGPTLFNLPNTVRNMNLEHNLMRGLPSAWLIENTLLTHLDLSYNRINHFDSSDCQPTSDNVTIDLRHNNITRVFIDLQWMKLLAEMNTPQPQRPVVLLGDNPFVCDCLAENLLQFTKGDLHQFLFTVDLAGLECQQPPRLKGHSVSTLDMADLTCDNIDGCPTPCACHRLAVSQALEVDCTYRNLTQIPEVVPFNTSILRMDGNNLQDIKHFVEPRWENLTQLHLSRNHIWEFEVTTFPRHLRILDLSHNSLKWLSDGTLAALNNATHVEAWLGGNPWRCDCDAKPLQDFLNVNIKRVGNLSTVQCHDALQDVPVYKAAVCPLEMPSSKRILIGATIVSLVMAVGMAMIGIGFYRYRGEVKVWLYAHRMCLWFVTESELDRDKRYDAFISFAQDDSEFVASHLLPGLETSDHQLPSFKVCIHYRDWLAGEWIPDQIIRSVQNSRRTIVVLSKNFIRSVWGRLEFKAAHHQALQDRTNRIIMVVLGDLPPSSEMDSELKMYVKFNTYLKWDDPWFWQKLRYAMPHNPLAKLSSPSWSSTTSPSSRVPPLTTRVKKTVGKKELALT